MPTDANAAGFDAFLAGALALPVDTGRRWRSFSWPAWTGLVEADLDRLWGEETERRLIAYREGIARSRPAEQVYALAERLLTNQVR